MLGPQWYTLAGLRHALMSLGEQLTDEAVVETIREADVDGVTPQTFRSSGVPGALYRRRRPPC